MNNKQKLVFEIKFNHLANNNTYRRVRNNSFDSSYPIFTAKREKTDDITKTESKPL